MPEFAEVCEQAARAGGAALRHWAGKFQVRHKGPADLVTEADLASQDAVCRILREAFPDHGLLGEEGGEVYRGSSDFRWIIDPLDGTTNYVHGLANYAVSVALEQRGVLLAGTVFDPVADECFTAARGCGAFLNGQRLAVSHIERLDEALVAASFPAKVERGTVEIENFVEVLLTAQAVRRLGSAALNLSYLAAGRFDAYWATETKSWDIAAGVLLVQEAGGTVSGLAGEDLDVMRGQVVGAATAALQRQLLSRLRPIAPSTT